MPRPWTRCSPSCSASGASSISWCMPSPSPTRPSSTAATSTRREKNFTQTMLISCYSFTALAQAGREADGPRRLAAHPHLLRRREGHAPLQRHGRGQGGARGQRPLSRRRPRQGRHSRQRHLGRARSRRWPPPASPTSATSCAGTSTTPRSGAPSPSRRWAPPASTCSPISSRGVTGEVHHVDAGYHVQGMKNEDAPDISVVKDAS